jgi:hypothetical protein
VPQHGLGHVKIGDDAVLHRADGDDVSGRAPDHLFGLVTDGQHCSRVPLHGHHRGLLQHDPAVADKNQGIGSTQVDSHIAGDLVEDEVQGHWLLTPFSGYLLPARLSPVVGAPRRPLSFKLT